jgi:hypothetical protein
MKGSLKAVAALAVLALGVPQTWSQKTVTIPLDRPNEQQPLNVQTEVETYRGLKSLRVVDASPQTLRMGFSSSC